MIGLDEPLAISVDPGKENILLFSEYSFVESVAGEALKRFPNLPTAKNTPDIMILIKTNHDKILVAIEAKMYDNPYSISLQQQMDNQSVILKYLKKELKLSKTYHVALLPAELYKNIDKAVFNYKTITWEDIYSKYKKIIGNGYFLEILRIALEKYNELAAKKITFGRNCEQFCAGLYIYDNYKNDILDEEINIMGRDGGLRGDKLLKDISSGGWQKRKLKPVQLKRLSIKTGFT